MTGNPAGDARDREGSRLRNFSPTIIRGVLVLDAVGCRQNAVYGAGLLDASGREVMDLRSGPNDVRHLAPGVYHVTGSNGTRRQLVVR